MHIESFEWSQGCNSIIIKDFLGNLTMLESSTLLLYEEEE